MNKGKNKDQENVRKEEKDGDLIAWRETLQDWPTVALTLESSDCQAERRQQTD